MVEVDFSVNRPGELRNDVVGVIALPAALRDLQPPGFIGRDSLARVLGKEAMDGLQVGVAPVVHRNPLDGVRECKALPEQGVASLHHEAPIERRAHECDAVDCRALNEWIFVAQAL
jgi:hypothetical protein